jgi:hypothetical protein
MLKFVYRKEKEVLKQIKENQKSKNSSFLSVEPTPNRRIPKPIEKPDTPSRNQSKSPRKLSKIDLLFKMVGRNSQISNLKDSVLSHNSSNSKIKPRPTDVNTDQTTAEESGLLLGVKSKRNIDHFYDTSEVIKDNSLSASQLEIN